WQRIYDFVGEDDSVDRVNVWVAIGSEGAPLDLIKVLGELLALCCIHSGAALDDEVFDSSVHLWMLDPQSGENVVRQLACSRPNLQYRAAVIRWRTLGRVCLAGVAFKPRQQFGEKSSERCAKCRMHVAGCVVVAGRAYLGRLGVVVAFSGIVERGLHEVAERDGASVPNARLELLGKCVHS